MTHPTGIPPTIPSGQTPALGRLTARPAASPVPDAGSAYGPLRITPSAQSPAAFHRGLDGLGQSQAAAVPGTHRIADVIAFSPAAQRLQAHSPAGLKPTLGYGLGGLQATTPQQARQALSASAMRLVAARVQDTPGSHDQALPARGPALPFYTNPAQANSVATSTNAARALGGVGRVLDANG
ncbi:MAG: hypothetical protein KatS3mg103_0079 [Phycisphaerales bacterium]|nr:MAG: hypothetical protein KatS3mg103_0079 [Phycisphaerales bacterium]